MTVAQIFERYGVAPEAQHAAYRRAGWGMAVHAVWLGPVLTWTQVYQALLFTDLGTPELTREVRKKVGVNKYVTTLIARADPKYAQTILTQNDPHQLVYVYALLRARGELADTAFSRVRGHVEAQCLELPNEQADVLRMGSTLSSMDILHYKNPSV